MVLLAVPQIKKAVKRLFDDTKVFYALKSKGAIHIVLRESPNNVMIISSRTKKSSWLGFHRGEGHDYIVDGYQTYSDGSDLLHVNFWGDGYANG